MVFEQTLARAYEIYSYFNKHQRYAHPVDQAYIMAVLEYEQFSEVFNPRNPVYYQVQFVNLVRSSPEAFIIRSKVRNGKLLDSAKNVMRELRNNS
jgi:hypothetical protein